MTKTLPLQFLEAATDIIRDVPGVGATFCGRYQPVGENELPIGGEPVVILRNEAPSDGAPDRMAADESDGICMINHRIMLRIGVYYKISLLDNLYNVSDSVVNAINTAMYNQVATLSMCAGLRWLLSQNVVEADAACVVLYYECFVPTKGNDWSLP